MEYKDIETYEKKIAQTFFNLAEEIASKELKKLKLENDKLREQLRLHNVINCAYSDEMLLEGFKALFGDKWKKNWSDYSKIMEMKSIIKGGTMPCVSFENWQKCIRLLDKHCL